MSWPGNICRTARAASFPLASEAAGGRREIHEGLRLAAIVTHVADARTCVLHPASTTHRQMNDAELAAAGVSPDLIRFSVGIEYVGDIIADIDNALKETDTGASEKLERRMREK